MTLDGQASAAPSATTGARPATHPGSHTVRYYEDDASLVAEVGQLVTAGLATGEPAVVIATPTHRDGLERRLKAQGVNLAEARHAGPDRPIHAAPTHARTTVR